MLILNQSETFIIGPIAKILGYIMEFIYWVLEHIGSGENGIANIGLCIIIFTIIMYLLMLPLTIKQQKFSKMSSIMNPEIKAIQKKYKDKKDQESMMKQNEEIQAVYQKYGVSATGGCLQMLIQLPIMFALYQVIMRIPAYVGSLFTKYETVVTALEGNKAAQDFFTKTAEKAANMKINFDKIDFDKAGDIKDLIDAMCKFGSGQLEKLGSFFDKANITKSINDIVDVNGFIFKDFSLTDSPSTIISNATSGDSIKIGLLILALLIPILAGALQYLNTKLIPQNTAASDEGTMASSLKTMNLVMPIMSVVFCFTFGTGIGLYWVMGSVVRCIQQVIINKHLNSMDVDDLIKKNMEKVNKKREKMGLPPQKISNTAKQNTRNISTADNEDRKKKAKESIKASTDYYKNASAKQGSLKAKANMVKQFNEKKKK